MDWTFIKILNSKERKMSASAKQDQHTEYQLQLTHKKETILSLMIEDMKLIKRYLCELRELGIDLKRGTNSSLEPDIICQ